MATYSYLPSWDNAYRVAQTKDFLRGSNLLYHEVTVRVLSITENAVVCRDTGGVERVALLADLSYASEFLARDNVGGCMVLKIRRWAK